MLAIAAQVCALDILGILGLLGASVRFGATSGITCRAIVGEASQTAACTQAIAAMPTGVFSGAAAAWKSGVQGGCLVPWTGRQRSF